jgi:hypothetical protein
MQKESQTDVVHQVRLGERQALSDEASKSLAQGVVPSLDMRSEPTLFACGNMLLGRDD